MLQQIRDKVTNLSRTFGGALPDSELLREYHIKGPLDPEKLQMLREERLQIMMVQDTEDTQNKWVDMEKEETVIKLDLADMVVEHLVKEMVTELNSIEKSRSSF